MGILLESCTFFNAVVVVLLVVLHHPGAVETAETFEAFADCPCLTAGELQARLSGTAFLDGSNCLRTASLPGICLPLTYGQEKCSAWDDDAYAACSGTSKPSWCEYSWCFVDPGSCSRPKKPSAYFPDTGLYFSYETCGYVDTFTNRVVGAALQNATLRVSYPSDEDWKLVTYENGTRTGAFYDLFHIIAQKWNMDLIEIPIPEQSRVQFPESSYTACVHAIAINSTDICIASFWITVERLTMLPFSYAIGNDVFYVVSRASRGSLSFVEMLSRPFLPFKPELWLALLGVMAGASIVYAFVESWSDGSEETDSSMSLGSRKRTSSFLDTPDGNARQRLAERKAWRAKAVALPDIFQQSLQGGFEGASLFMPESVAGKLLVTAFSFLVLVLGASYTAALTAFLAASKASYEYSGLDDLLAKRPRVCADAAVKKSLIGLNPLLEKLFVELSAEGGLDVLGAIDAGLCEAAITYEGSLEYRQNDHCDKAVVGQPVVVIGQALPMRPDLVQPISTEMVSVNVNGRWDVMVRDAKEKFLPENSCPSLNGDDGSASLGLAEMAGTILIFVLFLLGALVLHVVVSTLRSRKAKKMAMAAVSRAATQFITIKAQVMGGPAGSMITDEVTPFEQGNSSA